jgi:hypothetical protein
VSHPGDAFSRTHHRERFCLSVTQRPDEQYILIHIRADTGNVDKFEPWLRSRLGLRQQNNLNLVLLVCDFLAPSARDAQRDLIDRLEARGRNNGHSDADDHRQDPRRQGADPRRQQYE